MSYFENPKTLEELKQQWKKLCLKHHPDLGGSNEAMKEINADYERLFKLLEQGLSTEEKNKNYHTLEDGYREQVLKILFLPDIVIELIGSWLWVSGKTYTVAQQLRDAEFTWSKSKKMWYWSNAPKKRFYKGNTPINEIRNKYGSETIDREGGFSIGSGKKPEPKKNNKWDKYQTVA